MKLALQLALLLAAAALGLLAWRAGCMGRGSSEPPALPALVREAGSAPAEPLVEPAETTAVEGSARVGPPRGAPRVVVPASSEATSAPARPQPEVTAIHLRVLGKERGEPIEGERVYVRDARGQGWSAEHVEGSHGGVGKAPLTDAEGRATFTVKPGVDYRVGLAEREEDVEVPALAPLERRELEIRIATEPDRTVWGRLVDAESGQALGQGVVRLDPGFSSSREQPDVPVQADGTFVLHTRSWEEHFASAKAEGYAPRVFALLAGHETPDRALDVLFTRGAALEVAVLELGRPVRYATVKLSTDSYWLQQDHGAPLFYFAEAPTWVRSTGASGSATFADLPPRVPLRLAVDIGGGQQAEPVLLEPGERRRIEISIDSGATIFGRVVDGAGGAIRGCEVVRIAAESDVPALIEIGFFGFGNKAAATTRTDGQGCFRFENVPEGDWLVGPRYRPGKRSWSVGLGQVVHVEANATPPAQVLRVDRGLYLKGIVFDPDGRPAADCTVSAHATEADAFLSADTDREGRFSIGPAPAGTFSVQAGSWDSGFPESEPVVAEAGASGIELHLPRGGALRARVVDASGQLQRCEALLAREGDEEGWMEDSIDGMLVCQGLLPGTYTVNVCTSSGSCGRVSGVLVRAGETTEEIEIVVQPGARLKLRYTGEERFSNAEILVDGELFSYDSSERGTVSDLFVPAGRVEVRWHAGEVESVQRVTLAPGEEGVLAWDGKR